MWKVTFFFTQYTFSWTETYYLPGGVSLAAATLACQALAIARVNLNASQCFLSAIRLVLSTQPRKSYFLNPGSFAGQGTAQWVPGSDPDQDAAPQFVALQVKFFGALGNSCRRYLSGLPEGIFGTKLSGKNIEVLGLSINALLVLVGTLQQNNFSFRYRNQILNQLCQAVTTNAAFPGEIGVQFGQQMIAPVMGQPIQMAFKGFKKVNTRLFGIGGIYTVDPASPGITASAPPFVYYLRQTSQVQPSNIAQTGVGAQLSYLFDNFTNTGGTSGVGFNVLSGNHRKRGVSALALRGRSRSKP